MTFYGAITMEIARRLKKLCDARRELPRWRWHRRRKFDGAIAHYKLHRVETVKRLQHWHQIPLSPALQKSVEINATPCQHLGMQTEWDAFLAP